MIEPEELPEHDSQQVTSVSQAEVQNIHADVVQMHQSDAELITADEVEIHQSAVANLKANNIHARRSALAAVNAGEVLVQEGAIAAAQAEKVSISGYTGAVLAGNAEVRHALVGFVAGQDVHVNESRTVVLVGRNIYGNVTTLFNTRDALIVGLLSGLFSGLMLLLGRMLFGRK